MKKRIFTLLLLTVLAFSMTACRNNNAKEETLSNSMEETLSNTKEYTVNNTANDNVNNKNTSNNKLEVYTSFYPMYDFAVKVGGDKIHVTNLVPAGVEPHDWEPSTTDMVNLENADILIYNGAGMEHWIEQVSSSLENKNLVMVEASKGISLLEGGHDEEEEPSEEAEEVGYDPHVWLSIKNARLEMENIKNALVEADKENASYYEANYKTYEEKFDALDKEFTDTLTPLTNKSIVVAHKAFAYLCADYSLTQVPIEGLAADSEPDAKRMAEIIEFAKSNNVKTIFFEELVSPKVAETIASEIGASTEVLNPIEGLTEEQVSGGEDYLSIMEQNLNALKKALE